MHDDGMSDCLERGVRELSAEGVERRHETVMAWATGKLGLERSLAELIYALADEERLAPVYGFQLVHCGLGVRELESAVETSAEASVQQDAPAWIESPPAPLDEVVRERRLRQSFRRFRGFLERLGDPTAAARAYVAEPDVEPLDLAGPRL